MLSPTNLIKHAACPVEMSNTQPHLSHLIPPFVAHSNVLRKQPSNARIRRDAMTIGKLLVVENWRLRVWSALPTFRHCEFGKNVVVESRVASFLNRAGLPGMIDLQRR